jgi:hypothetical protein
MRLDLGPSLEAVKAAAIIAVDEAAEVARLQFITPGAGQAMEYQSGEAEARAYLADSSPDPANYPFLVAELNALVATGGTPTLAEVAAEVDAQAAAWRAVGSYIKELRRTAKMQIDAANSVAAVRAAQQIAWPTA